MFNLNTTTRKLMLFIGSQGTVVKKGLGYIVKNNIVTTDKIELDPETLIEITYFNFSTNKIRLKCIKGVRTYVAEVDYSFIGESCNFEHKDVTNPVECIISNHHIHNIINKDTAIFIILFILTFICGLVLGKVL